MKRLSVAGPCDARHGRELAGQGRAFTPNDWYRLTTSARRRFRPMATPGGLHGHHRCHRGEQAAQRDLGGRHGWLARRCATPRPASKAPSRAGHPTAGCCSSIRPARAARAGSTRFGWISPAVKPSSTTASRARRSPRTARTMAWSEAIPEDTTKKADDPVSQDASRFPASVWRHHQAARPRPLRRPAVSWTGPSCPTDRASLPTGAPRVSGARPRSGPRPIGGRPGCPPLRPRPEAGDATRAIRIAT